VSVSLRCYGVAMTYRESDAVVNGICYDFREFFIESANETDVEIWHDGNYLGTLTIRGLVGGPKVAKRYLMGLPTPEAIYIAKKDW
jgi:hypothetical protein